MIRPRQYVFLLGFALLPHITEIVNWVWIASALVVGWALWTDHKPKFKPSPILIHALTLLFPTLIYLEFNTLLGPDAATSLLLLMITLKLFEVYTYRDAVVILALTLLMAMYHLVFRQDLFTTLYMLGVMIWTFYLLFKLNRPSQAPQSQKLQLKNFIGPEVLVSIPLLLVLFFFFPRISSPIGRFIEKKGDQTGFSEDLRPGDLADMANSDSVAFRVELKGGRPLRKDELYFRGQTLEVTDGINWIKGANREQVEIPVYNESDEGQHYRITFEPRFKDLVFSIDQTYAFRLQGAASSASYYDNATIKTRRNNQQKFQLVGVRSDSRLQYINSKINHTKLPARFYEYNPQTTALLEKIKSEHTGVAQKMQAIRSYFKNSDLIYSFQTPEYPNLDQLLFEKKLGFCEHFASAATLMARALDIPSRVVIGFQGGELNQYGNYLVVRDRHAHAWMEYVNEMNEWERMDPTSHVSDFRISQGLTLDEIEERKNTNATLTAIAKDLWNMMDNLNNEFALALLNMNKDAQIDWLKKLGIDAPTRKTIWKVFAGVVVFVLLSIFLVLWLRKPKVDPLDRLRQELISKLSALDVGYTDDLGPLETLKLLQKKKPESTQLQAAVRSFADLKYSPDSHQSINEISERLRQL